MPSVYRGLRRGKESRPLYSRPLYSRFIRPPPSLPCSRVLCRSRCGAIRHPGTPANRGLRSRQKAGEADIYCRRRGMLRAAESREIAHFSPFSPHSGGADCSNPALKGRIGILLSRFSLAGRWCLAGNAWGRAMTPEQKARQPIDRQLDQCGWLVQNANETNISAGLGVAIREFPLKTGFAER